MKTGAELITEERQRQVSQEGWSAEHDDSHTNHKLAVKNGGTNDPENLVACCFSCNIAKRTKSYEEFVAIAKDRERLGGGRPRGMVQGENTPEQDARLLVGLYGLNYEKILAILKEARRNREAMSV